MRRLPLLGVLFTSCAFSGSYLSPPPAAPKTAAELAAQAPSETCGGCTQGQELAIPPASASQPTDAAPSAEAATRARLVAAARSYLDTRYRGDCSTFVRRVYSDAGLRLEMRPARKASEGLYLAMNSVDLPLPGDLAFFRDTYGPPSRPGEPQRLTHVAVVEGVQGRIVTLIHRGSKGIARISLDLERPHDRNTNTPIRFRRRGDRSGTFYLTGELLTGFGSHPGLSSLPGLAAREP